MKIIIPKWSIKTQKEIVNFGLSFYKASMGFDENLEIAQETLATKNYIKLESAIAREQAIFNLFKQILDEINDYAPELKTMGVYRDINSLLKEHSELKCPHGTFHKASCSFCNDLEKKFDSLQNTQKDVEETICQHGKQEDELCLECDDIVGSDL